MSDTLTKTRDEYAQRVERLVKARLKWARSEQRVLETHANDLRIDDARAAEERAHGEWDERLAEFLRFVRGEAEGRAGS